MLTRLEARTTHEAATVCLMCSRMWQSVGAGLCTQVDDGAGCNQSCHRQQYIPARDTQMCQQRADLCTDGQGCWRQNDVPQTAKLFYIMQAVPSQHHAPLQCYLLKKTEVEVSSKEYTKGKGGDVATPLAFTASLGCR